MSCFTFDDNTPAMEAIKSSKKFNEQERILFVTGEAGSGKTELLKTICEGYDNSHTSYLTVAPTGVAAINCEGTTIHSAFKLPIGMNPKYPLDIPYLNQKFDKKAIAILERIEVLIIDEVSMVSGHLLDLISKRLCQVKRKNNKIAFGGIKVIMIGDLLQLPPVIGELDRETYYAHYSSPWFFAAKAMNGVNLRTILLSKNYRQESDPNFQKVLGCIRAQDKLEKIVEFVNKYCVSKQDEDCENTIICSTNKLCDFHNIHKLKRINSEVIKLESITSGAFPEKIMPVKSSIEIKIGCKIMIARNIYENMELLASNGDVCTVESYDPELGLLLLRKERDSEIIECTRVEWTNYEFGVNNEGTVVKKSIGVFEQFPIKLGYAVTVHKSQGVTLEKCFIDIENVFASGLFYVALTRCRTLKGIKLKRNVKQSDLSMDEGILKIYKQIEKNNSLFE